MAALLLGIQQHCCGRAERGAASDMKAVFCRCRLTACTYEATSPKEVTSYRASEKNGSAKGARPWIRDDGDMLWSIFSFTGSFNKHARYVMTNSQAPEWRWQIPAVPQHSPNS